MMRMGLIIERIFHIVSRVHPWIFFNRKRECLDKNAQQAYFWFLLFEFRDDLLDLGDIEGLLVVKMRNAIAIVDHLVQFFFLVIHFDCSYRQGRLYVGLLLFWGWCDFTLFGFGSVLDKVNDIFFKNPSFPS